MTIWSPNLIDREGLKYVSIAKAIEADIADGILRPSERLPTQRRLAQQLGVTIGTVGRAYALAERNGLIRCETGRGSFVSRPEPMAGSPGGMLINLGLNVPPGIGAPKLFSDSLHELANQKNIGLFFDSAPLESGQADRQAACDWVSRRLPCSLEEIQICSGTQNALVALLQSLVKPGDSLLVEELTFPGLLAAASFLNIKTVPVSIDKQGLVPGELEKIAKPNQVLYCVPTNHNPTGVTMSSARRKAIAKIALQKNLQVIEDDVYGLTISEAPPPLTSWLPDQGYLICSLAKSTAIGLRLAYLRFPQRRGDKLRMAFRATGLFPPPLLVSLVTSWISDGTADQILARKKEESVRRMRLARDLLSKHDCQGEAEGNHLWLTLNDDWSATAMEKAARAKGVIIYPAGLFTESAKSDRNGIRISLGGARNESELAAGLNKINSLLETADRVNTLRY